MVVAQCPEYAYIACKKAFVGQKQRSVAQGSLIGKTRSPVLIAISTLKPKREVSMLSCASLHNDRFGEMWYQFIPATELLSQYP